MKSQCLFTASGMELRAINRYVDEEDVVDMYR